MKKKLIFLIALCSALLSCSDKAKTEVEELRLAFEPLTVDSLLIGRSYGMLLANSNLLIADSQADSLFHWVDLKKLTSRQAGRIGQGPDEFLHFNDFYCLNGEYGFYDSRLRSMNKIVFLEDRIQIEKKVQDKSKNYRLVPTAYNTFIGIGPYENGLFNVLDSAGNSIRMVGEQPYRDEEERKIPELARAMAYQGEISISPKGDRLVHAIFMTPMISFYKLTPAGVELVKSNVDCYPEYRPELGDNSYASAMSRSNVLGYIKLAVTDKYVYALLSGRSIEKSGLSAFTGDKIRVYDWEGNLVKVLICNTEFNTLCVSSDDSIIYGIGLMDDYELLKAKLK